MKIPKEIVTRNKIRDAKILSLYLNDAESFESIGARFGISHTRVGQIIYANRHLLKLDQDYEKSKRINHLKRILKSRPDSMVSKDAVDVIDRLRVESDDKDNQGSRSETKVIIIRESASANQDQSRAVSGPVSVVRV